MSSSQKPLDIALRFLSKAERTQFELKSHLANKGLCSSDIEQVVQQCNEWGYLNDERVCQREIQLALSSNLGPLKIQTKLMRRGWSEDEAAAYVSRVEPQSFHEIAIKLAEASKNKGSTPRKVARQLTARGFTQEQVRDAMESCFADFNVD
ncbi:RecX family transcriptional regulator [Kamptonema cortianum]|nr:RecX family transcriptional regulator [Geitlerinema splendidum]MDK3160932.1 RecX family transcriptional regulator [Kamptonema cortianum]